MSDLRDFIDIEAATAAFGEPQYGFFRQHVAYSSGRKRGAGQHYVSSESIEITEQEYRENVEQAKKNELARFFSNSKKPFRDSYWRYEKRVVTPGWPQVMQKMIEEFTKS